MMDYQSMFRGDLAILDALLRFAKPITEENLRILICPDGDWLSEGTLRELLHAMVDAGYVHAVFNSTCTASLFSLATKGRAHLIAEEVKASLRVQSDFSKPEEQIRITCCDHGAPVEGATALICLSEDELDDWWEALDVELKADAFSGFALRMRSGIDSRIHIEPPVVGVPILGTCGERDAELFGKKAPIAEAANAAR